MYKSIKIVKNIFNVNIVNIKIKYYNITISKKTIILEGRYEI